jgi:hypothetical protein
VSAAPDHDTRPVDREYLNLRLSELDARMDARFADFGRNLAELESRLDRRMVSVLVGFLGPMMVAVLATLIAVIIK